MRFCSVALEAKVLQRRLVEGCEVDAIVAWQTLSKPR